MAKFVWLKADADFSYFYSDLGTPGGEYVLLKEILTADYESRVRELEAERDRLKEDLKLQAKSYDANSKGGRSQRAY